MLDKIRKKKYSHRLLCSHCCVWASGEPKSLINWCVKKCENIYILYFIDPEMCWRWHDHKVTKKMSKRFWNSMFLLKSKDAQFYWKEIAEQFHWRKKLSLTIKKLSNSCPQKCHNFFNECKKFELFIKTWKFYRKWKNRHNLSTHTVIHFSMKSDGLKFSLEVKV